MIQNKNLNKYEKNWLEKILSVDFSLKKSIILQINQADIIQQYTDSYLSVKFVGIYLSNNSSEYIGVPLEMRAYLGGGVPIQFFLHVKNGVVSELEAFKADSSKISSDIDLDNAKIEILVDSRWG